MSTVAVVGAGAAGIMAALNVDKKHRVLLLEGNGTCGKKILLTGNGRCNYWNSDMGAHMYETDCSAALEKIMSDENISSALNCLDSMGIYPKIKNGYYYPYSNQAASVREIFKQRIDSGNIEFIPDFKVTDIKRNGKGFEITAADGRACACSKVILAAGSKAAPKTGSDGSGYNLAEGLGHSINNVCPGLTPLISKGKFLKEWEKIRCDARVSLYINDRLAKSDTGELQLTATGISGICTFNISGAAARACAKGYRVRAEINFMPNIDGGFYNWFTTRCAVLGGCSVEHGLESIFNYKLMFVLLKAAGIKREDSWLELPEDKKRALCKAVECFSLDIVGAESFDKAQVCTGGVPLKEINPCTMESRITDGLYFAGEILDADGRCGGYNLAFAFISGYIAGRSV